MKQLTSRQIEVLQLMAAGQSVTQIAKLLDVSVNTVSTHKTRLVMKLKLNSYHELLVYAVRMQLVAEWGSR